MRRKVLLVEDDGDVLDLLNNTFRKTGDFDVVTARDGAEALRLVHSETLDVVLLDLMLPGMTGFEVCRILKTNAATKLLPIIILTAKADEFDRINGFELGADDYVTKPFSPREVLLRVRAVMRRTQLPVTDEVSIQAGPIVLDQSRRLALLNNKTLRLTTTEFKLLTALIERRGRVLTRDRLLNEVWGYASSFNTRTVDTHMRRLREKLGSFCAQIETVRGFGYRMKDTD